MSDFVNSLQHELLKVTGQDSAWGEINPIVIIGLTESVLDLGVSEDGLYKAIRAYSRQIAAFVSPDRTKNVTKERLDQVMFAFNYLDDRANYDKALSDFRTLKAEDRREIRILRETVKSLRHQIHDLESRSEAVIQERKNLESKAQEFNRQKIAEALYLPSVREDNKLLTDKCRILTRGIDESNKIARELKNKVSDPYNYISSFGKIDFAHTFIFEAKWVVIMTIESLDDYSLYNSPLNDTSNFSPEFMRHALILGIKKNELEQIKNLWLSSVSMYGRPDNFESKMTFPAITLLKLNAGKPVVAQGFSGRFKRGERFIGSISSDQMEISRSKFLGNLHRDTVTSKLTTSVSTGSMLVSVAVNNGKKGARWNLNCPSFRFKTTRLVLGVG